MRKIWAVLAAAVTVAAAGLVTVPAQASSSVDQTQWMRCRDGKPPRAGHIRLAVVDDSEDGEYGLFWVTVEGWIDRCVKPRPDDEFAITEFYGPARRPGRYATHYYRNIEAGGRLRDAIPMMDYTDVRAICLSSREGRTARTSTRIDCVSVTWTAEDEKRHRPPRIGRHLSPRDPIVRRAAEPYGPARPGCNNCWK